MQFVFYWKTHLKMFSIVEFSDNFRRIKPLSIYCGAGISFNSGIPTVYSLVWNIVYSLLENKEKTYRFLETYKERKVPFEAFMQTVIEISEDEQILEIFEYGLPNFNHHFIANLCSKGYVREVFTTNFDTLIEKALEHAGLQRDRDFLVFGTESEFKKGIHLSEKKDNRIRVFKIHGSIDNRESIRTTINSIYRNDWLHQRREIIKHAFVNTEHKHLLIMGYSFSDIFDINPILKKEYSGLTLPFLSIIDHEPGLTGSEAKNLRDGKFNLKFGTCFNGCSILHDTEAIVKNLWNLFGFPRHDDTFFDFSAPAVWPEDISAWKMRMLPGQSEYLMAALHFNFNQYPEALEYSEKALKKSKNKRNTQLELDILYQKATIKHRLGDKKSINEAKNLAYRIISKSELVGYDQGLSKSLGLYAVILLHNEGNYIEAEGFYRKSLVIQKRIGDLRGQSITLLSIGSCLRHKEEYAGAVESCKKSLYLRKHLGDIPGAGRCHQGLGNIYLDQGDWKHALNHYKRFHKISEDTDDTWALGTASYKIAECLFLKGTKKSLNEALSLIEQSITIRKNTISREYGNALFLKANILSAGGKIEESMHLHDSALYIRQSLKENQADIADSYFQIGLLKVKTGKLIEGFDLLYKSGVIYFQCGYRSKTGLVEKTLYTMMNNVDEGIRDKIEILLQNLKTASFRS